LRTFTSLDELRGAVGEHLGYSDWRVVDQKQVDQFAEATGDRQWIHVDPERAGQGPFGTTIAHGYLVLSLVPALVAEVWRVDWARMAVNYGLNRVRFPSPVPTGTALRAGVRLLSVDDVTGGLHLVTEVTIEKQGEEKPCCVAETLSRIYL
jgi:acyl dehydratase